MITINLHDYRQELVKVGIQKTVVKAVSIVIAAVLLIIGYWFLQQIKLDGAKAEIAGLEQQVNSMAGEVKKVNDMKARTQRAREIMAGIEELRATQFPVTRILEDLTLSIPDEIWLTSLKQMTLKEIFKHKIPVILFGNPDELDPKKSKKKKKRSQDEPEIFEFLEVKGRVFGQYGDQILTEYLETLRQVPQFKEVFLHQTLYSLAGTFPIRAFTIYAYMPKKEEAKKK